MAKLYDISTWNEQSWLNTGGTRDKKIYLSPKGEQYFFKQSFKKGNRDYKYEFWSEIVASEIGELLGFNILSYHIAIRGDVIGCISKSMIDQESEELVEIGKYLQAFDPTFNPTDIKLRYKYNFDLILGAFNSFYFQGHLKWLIETIVFDTLIGNSDRHQENWAIINKHTVVTRVIHEIEKKEFEKAPWFIRKIIETAYFRKGKLRPEIKQIQLKLPTDTRIAPIYDSGCSFGRELSDEKVLELLNDDNKADAYVKKGQSEIHLKNSKVGHFEFIEFLLKQKDFDIMTKEIIDRTIKNFDIKKIESIINNIDIELIKINHPEKLPTERKELILKIITLRYSHLKDIVGTIK